MNVDSVVKPKENTRIIVVSLHSTSFAGGMMIGGGGVKQNGTETNNRLCIGRGNWSVCSHTQVEYRGITRDAIQ